MKHDHELDARGLLCPLPILKTRFKLDTLAPGEVLKVISTDPGSVRDMAAFARQTGHRLLHAVSDDREHVFYLQKA